MIQSVFPASHILHNNSYNRTPSEQASINSKRREEERAKVKELCKIVSCVQNHGSTVSVFPHPDSDKDDFVLRVLIEWRAESGFYFAEWLDVEKVEIDNNDNFMSSLSNIIKNKMNDWKMLEPRRTDDINSQKTYNQLNK